MVVVAFTLIGVTGFVLAAMNLWRALDRYAGCEVGRWPRSSVVDFWVRRLRDTHR